MKKLQTLEELLKAVDCKQEFNIVEDLKNLESTFGVLKAKDFRKKLSALTRKYEESELTEIRNTVVKGCLDGNPLYIKIYMEHFIPTVTSAENDGLLDVLTAKGAEVFNK